MLIQWWELKIVGVVNGYSEAEDIEEIVKVFVIEQRVLSLLSNKNNVNIDSNDIILPNDDIKYFEKSDEKTINDKINKELKPLFNVRGIN